MPVEAAVSVLGLQPRPQQGFCRQQVFGLYRLLREQSQGFQSFAVVLKPNHLEYL